MRKLYKIVKSNVDVGLFNIALINLSLGGIGKLFSIGYENGNNRGLVGGVIFLILSFVFHKIN